MFVSKGKDASGKTSGAMNCRGHVRGLLGIALLLLLAGSAAQFLISPPTWAQGAKQERPPEAKPIPGPPRTLPTPRSYAVERNPSQPARVYSGTPRGLFVSDDGGQSWAALPVERTHEEVFSLAVHPTDPSMVVVGRRDGLWKTSDSGRTWISLAYPTTGPYIPLAVAIAESQPNSIYVATAREGVFKSADGGYRWADASKGLPQATAGGRPAEIRTLVVHPRNPDTAYVAHERHGVYRTTDGGASWQRFDHGLPLPAWRPTYSPRFAFDPDDPNRLYVVFGQPIHSRLVRNRLYVTSATGEWLPVQAGLPSNTAITGLTVDRATRALHFWTEDTIWELPLPAKP